MKKIFNYSSLIAVLALLVFVSCQEQVIQPDNPSSNGSNLYKGFIPSFESFEPAVIDLLAGQDIPVGKVIISNDEENLTVTFKIDVPGWCLEETHLAVAADLEGIPQTKKGNPIPGQFEFSKSDLGCVEEDSYTIPLDAIEGYAGCGNELFIAAHAVVDDVCDYDTDLVTSLPDQATMKVQYPFAGGPAYFPETTVIGGGLDGVYPGWCVDTENVIYENTQYDVLVYSSYETLPDGVVDRPDNLDKVNWIINQGFVGQDSPGCTGSYTYGDVQRAIWTLVDDQVSNAGLGSWSQCRADEILAAANTDGEGFVPECGDVMAVIFAPVGGQQVIIAQVIVGAVAVPCIPIYCDETAWGDGADFPGKNWATYISYTAACPPVCDQWIVYGSNLNGGTDPLDDAIYAYDLNAKTQTLVYDPTPVDGSQNYPNANAFDPVNQRIYFGTDDGRLFYYQIGSSTHVQVHGGATSGSFGTMHNASWYNGKLYYIAGNGPTLYEVTIAGGVATRTNIGSVPRTGGYGDLVFDPANPGRFVAVCSSGWYWYDVTDNASGLLSHQGDGDATLRQLAYGSDGTLYAVKATTGEFYTAEYDIVAGTVTHTFFWDSPYTYTDLASGPQCQ